MRGVRFNKAERDFLRALLLYVDGKDEKLAAQVLGKIEAAVEVRAGVNVGPIETALLVSARGKVIKLEGGHARASAQCTAMKVTEADATLVGEWMARQGWLTGPMTLLDVLNKWHQWLPKARATQPPPALQPGLGNNAVQGPGEATGVSGGVQPAERRPAPGNGRPLPGFR